MEAIGRRTVWVLGWLLPAALGFPLHLHARAELLCEVAGPGGRAVITNVLPGGRCDKPVAAGEPAPSGSRLPLASRPVDRSVAVHAGRYGVSQKLVKAVIQAESGGNPLAVSPKGAQGIMQLMPATSRRFDVADPLDPDANIEGGVRYLSYLLDRYGGNTSLALAAYNAGEGAVDRHGGIPPYQETKHYVSKVMELAGGRRGKVRREPAEPPAPRPVVVRRTQSGGILLEN